MNISNMQNNILNSLYAVSFQKNFKAAYKIHNRKENMNRWGKKYKEKILGIWNKAYSMHAMGLLRLVEEVRKESVKFPS